jgi:iron complex transport system substrate-binding protein
MPRIISLLASSTEIVCALGFEASLVGRSHECDYPPSVRRLPVCTGPRFDVKGSSAEIDRRVKEALQTGPSVYQVDARRLRELRPEVILTQTQCEVCAVSERDVETALADWPGERPRVVALAPNALADVWEDIQRVADALGAPERGRELVARLHGRVDAITIRAGSLTRRPTVACIEWVDPLMAAGNWVPELVALAGGEDRFGTAGRHAPAMTWEKLRDTDPEVIVVMPCGLDLERTRQETATLAVRPGWPELWAVRSGRVYVADGNQFFNRPGPRLVESLEILTEVLHPEAFNFGHRGTGWQPY